MANRIPLVVVSGDQAIKELPVEDDLSLGNSSLRNVATANVGNINTTNLVVTTANITTANITTANITTANITTANITSFASLNTVTANITTIVTGNTLTISTGTASNSNIVISANGTEYIRVTNVGNVGIGVTNPTGRLDVTNRGITRGSLPAGSILQIVSNTITAAATVSGPNGTEVSVTGYSATITPTSNTSKILIMLQLSYCSLGTTYGGYFKRGSTIISQGDAASNRQRVGFPMALATDLNQGNSFFYQFLDSPATTNSTTYQLFVNNDNTVTLFLNRSSADADNTTGKRSTSTITLIEVAV